MGDYECYGCINVDVIEKSRDLIRKLVDETSFHVNCHGDIYHEPGTDGARGLFTEFKELIETLYVEIGKLEYDAEFSMFGKIIVNFTDYEEANEVLVMAVNSERKITVFPDNS